MTVAVLHPHAYCVACQVLSDVGDGQSLQQNLSTFSAHVRRLRLILGAVTPRSLALLDEVGSGAQFIGFQAPHHTTCHPCICLKVLTA